MIDALTRSRFEAMRWNSPLSESHADRLFDELGLDRAGSLLDLGCGWGAMLLHAAARLPGGAHATGVDTDSKAIEYGRAAARLHGLQDRVTLVQADATRWGESAEVVLGSGVSHAWEQPLVALRANVAPGGPAAVRRRLLGGRAEPGGGRDLRRTGHRPRGTGRPRAGRRLAGAPRLRGLAGGVGRIRGDVPRRR